MRLPFWRNLMQSHTGHPRNFKLTLKFSYTQPVFPENLSVSYEYDWKNKSNARDFSRIVTVMHFTDRNWIPKTAYCIGCAMVCKIAFTNWDAKITLLRASKAMNDDIMFDTKIKFLTQKTILKVSLFQNFN